MQLTVVNHITQFIIFHYNPLFLLYHYFYHYHHYSHFCCEKWYTFSCDTALNSEMQFQLYHFIVLFVVLFHSFGVHLVCDTAFGMQHTKFLGGYVWPGDLWVMFRSPRVTYYTSHSIGFNVNYSYLYLYKI